MSGVGITFDETHSFRDWGLKLKKIEIGIPKTEYVSVPGMNGDLDLTEAQNGGIKYEMRELKFTFGVRNCSYEKWSSLISQIASDIQGVEKRIILDTDKGFYYVGRCEVDTSKSNDVTAEIAVTCTCEPYKRCIVRRTVEVGYVQLPQRSDSEYVRHYDQCYVKLAESYAGRLGSQ